MQFHTPFEVGMSALPLFFFLFFFLIFYIVFISCCSGFFFFLVFFLCTAGLEQTVVCTCSLLPGEGATVCSPGPNVHVLVSKICNNLLHQVHVFT